MTVIMAWERSQGNRSSNGDVTAEKPVSTLRGPMWRTLRRIQFSGDLRSANAAAGYARTAERDAGPTAPAAPRTAGAAAIPAGAAPDTAGAGTGNAGTRCTTRQTQARSASVHHRRRDRGGPRRHLLPRRGAGALRAAYAPGAGAYAGPAALAQQRCTAAVAGSVGIGRRRQSAQRRGLPRGRLARDVAHLDGDRLTENADDDAIELSRVTG